MENPWGFLEEPSRSLWASLQGPLSCRKILCPLTPEHLICSAFSAPWPRALQSRKHSALLDPRPPQLYRTSGGAGPGNRFVAFVRAYARPGCLVELDLKSCVLLFSLFPFGLGELSLFHFGLGELSLFPGGGDGPRGAALAQQVARKCCIGSYPSRAISQTWCPRI